MHCPFCNEIETKVIDSRLVGEGKQVRRRRECILCNERFTSYEVAELAMPRIVKSNGVRQPFDEDKLRNGMLKALQKRSVSTEEVEETVHRIMYKLRATGEREVDSQVVGEMVMDEMRKLDPVGYVRFASIYRSFQDIEAFNDEIKKWCHA